jgi:hypothetical protein
MTGSVSRDVDVFEKAASEVGLSPETKDMFRREFSAEELLLMSRYLRESRKEYARKKFLVRVAFVLFAAIVTFLLVAFAWDRNTRSFSISPWFIVFMPLIIALIILPISYILRKRKTKENNAPLTGERKLRYYAQIAIENEEVRKATNIVKTLKPFQD